MSAKAFVVLFVVSGDIAVLVVASKVRESDTLELSVVVTASKDS